jgi:tripartite-type tricarboxylate transporter receptor subunit TctC
MDDFSFICGVGEKPLSIVVPASWGVSNLSEWIEYLNAHNLEATVGTSGAAGSIPAFGAEAVFPMLQKLGLKSYNIVNYNGSGETIPALLSGEINCGFFHPHEAKPYMDSGDFKVIAIATDERSDKFPDIPTFKEQGVDFTLAVYEGFIAPAGLDPAIRDYLESAFLKILDEGKNYKAYAEGALHQVKPMTGEEFRQAIADQTELFKTMFGKS